MNIYSYLDSLPTKVGLILIYYEYWINGNKFKVIKMTVSSYKIYSSI